MKILLADDDPIVLSSLCAILESESDIEIVGSAQNGSDAIAQCLSLKPDIALFDIRMGEVSGIDAAKAVLKENANIKILFLTTFSDDEYIEKALEIGVKGYILKQDYEKIAPALRAVLSGQNVLGESVVKKLPELFARNKPGDLTEYGLDERELKIASLIAEGLTNREIANRVFLSEGTVRNCISAILEKLNLRDRTQLAIFYIKNSGV